MYTAKNMISHSVIADSMFKTLSKIVSSISTDLCDTEYRALEENQLSQKLQKVILISSKRADDSIRKYRLYLKYNLFPVL